LFKSSPSDVRAFTVACGDTPLGSQHGGLSQASYTYSSTHRM